MKNKIVGMIVIGLALVIAFITWSFNHALTNIVDASCSHGPACPMYGEISFQTNVGIGLIVLIIIIGLYLIFFGEDRVEIIRKIRIKTEKKAEEEKKDYSKITKTMTADEKKIFGLVLDAKGVIFQSELNEKSQFDKVKVTRILDRLEGQGLIERRRRGMTNVVILK
ncbi:MAG: MarR family transcriptional regulator [Nanoarchaeota archaeon]|nr:MarR family transcriptional regulator [Nanoarchaeota archaeon]